MKHIPNQHWPFREVRCGRDLRNWAQGEDEGIFPHEAMPEHVSACGDDFDYARHPKSYERELKKKDVVKGRHAARKHKRQQ